MAQRVSDHRLIPYLQRHEFEALVLGSLDALESLLQDARDLEGIAVLKNLVRSQAPEEINDGETSAPSKRLEGLIPSYRKTIHGPLAIAETGLPALRAKCPRFDAWVTSLEALGETKP
jgi:hypothetical protein